MGLTHAARTRLRLLFSRRDAEGRMEEEFRFHIDMEADRLVRDEQLDPAEARRRARIAFGLAERYKDQMRDGRGLAWLGGLSLDFKLAGRMLVKYARVPAAPGDAVRADADRMTKALTRHVILLPLRGGSSSLSRGSASPAARASGRRRPSRG